MKFLNTESGASKYYYYEALFHSPTVAVEVCDTQNMKLTFAFCFNHTPLSSITKKNPSRVRWVLLTFA